ncbi:hypothetical protein [Kineococcus aurantiacus]|uniref:hypothetical protein n=1 Tax=Kineococcus aurantiacus TaxID=37633 RepID=UPI0031E00EEE
MSDFIVYEDHPLPVGRAWLVTAQADVQTAVDALPRVRLRMADEDGLDAAVTGRVLEGRSFAIEVQFEDAIAPADWDPTMHPSLRRKLEKQRTVWSTYLATERSHVGASGLDVRVDSAWSAHLGWVLPAPMPGFAYMGLLRPFAGWHLLVVRGGVGSFVLQAPAWWGPADRSPGRVGPDQAGPADGTLTVMVTLQPA